VKQTEMENIKYCQICGHSDFSVFLELKDWFLTQEQFVICRCNKCDFHFTNPSPIAADLNKYYESEDYISHTTKKSSILKTIYLIARHITLRSKFKRVSKLANGNSILDIGCGTGELLNHFKSKGWQATGIEPNEKAREFASQKYRLDVYDVPEIKEFQSQSYDVITMWHVLEHVEDLNGRIEEAKRLLTKGGTLFVALPNHRSLDAQVYGKYWAAYDVPRHLYHFSPDTSKILFEKHNLTVQEIVPMKIDAYYICMLSEKYKSGKVKYIKGFFDGFKSNRYALKNNMEYSSLIYVIKND